MALNTSGMFLEEIRLSGGNGTLTFSPRNMVTDRVAFDAIEKRADYVILASSTDPAQRTAEMADPTLRFDWTRNDPSVTRFDYDGYARRWLPMPGGPPDAIGLITNAPRLTAPVPDLSEITAPYDIYVGTPTRLLTFSIQTVPDEGSFSPPDPGTVQISSSDGKLNFSDQDLNLYSGQPVLVQRQSFFDRTQRNGRIGDLPSSPSLDYFLFLNPRPASGQRPLVRIGYGPYLSGAEVPDEASLGSPSPGTFTWALDTGRIRLSPADLAASLEEAVYYSGVLLGSVSLSRTTVGPVTQAFPSPAFTIPSAVGITDDRRFVVFSELAGQPRKYLNVKVSDSAPTSTPGRGTATINSLTGEVFMNLNDVLTGAGRDFGWVDTVVGLERGVSVQFYRSGVNGYGEAQGPDFNILYGVTGQVIQDGLGRTPFVMLPTVPTVGPSLGFSVVPAPSSTGTFTGPLNDGANPSLSGLCYILDLDARQVKFGNRRTVDVTVQRSSPFVKAPDAALSPRGLQVSRNGEPLVPGTDFSLDESTGLIEFTRSVGEGGANDVLGISGTSSLPDIFTSDTPAFSPSDVGRAIFIRSGLNQGYYVVKGFSSSTSVTVSPAFLAAQPDSVDLRDPGEDLIDRFWTPLLPPFKKITVSRAPSPSGTFVQIPNTDFTVLPTTGQVNLKDPAKPGEAFSITYVSLDSEDEGVTTTPTNRVERALFKIRQEPVSTTVGSRSCSFNAAGSRVNTSRPIVLYVDGVTQDAGSFSFTSPGTLTLANPVTDGQSVIVDYWVEDATGGNSSFNLLHTPVDVDFPQIVAGEVSASFNGDQSGALSPGSGVLIAGREVVMIKEMSYSAASDITSVTFETAPSIGLGNASIMVCPPVNGSFMVQETSPVDVMAGGTNAMRIVGDRQYKAGTIVTINGDPYLVLSATYDESSNRTIVTLASPAQRNYVIPSVTRTIRPVILPGSSFTTSMQASTSAGFTLVRMGNRRKVLTRDVDYSVLEGGVITLAEELVYGDSLHAMYVARVPQPAGTRFTLNYAHAVAPSQSNGLQGQRLVMTYDLWAPDSFFFRTESFYTFLPEAQALLESSSQSGGGGPDVADRSSPKPKDAGTGGLYFNERSARNLDEIFSRLLLFYNDLVNQYEDVLASLDGRVVGGTSGRFRYDGNPDNPSRDAYSEITNDIDDRIKKFDRYVLSSLSPFEMELVPVYASMAQSNRLSRLFPLFKTVTVAIGDNVGFDANGQDMGSTGVENIRFALSLRSARSNSWIQDVDNTGTNVSVSENGNVELLVPEFKVGQKLRFYGEDGTPGSLVTVTSVITGNPVQLTLDFPVPSNKGSLMHATEEGDSTVSFYAPGRDLMVDYDSGNVVNFTLPPPLDSLQNPPVGQELLDLPLVYLNQDTAAARLPVLDGQELMDDGRVSQPRLRVPGERFLLEEETLAMSTLGRGELSGSTIVLSSVSIPLVVGDIVRFLNGPNAGLERQVVLVLGPGSYSMSAGYAGLDPAGSDFLVIGRPQRPIDEVVADEVSAMSARVAGPPVSPTSLVPVFDSGIVAVKKAIGGFGPEVTSGTGTVSLDTITDTSQDFTASGVTTSSLLFIPSGPNTGLYKISSIGSTSLTVDTALPYSGFPSAGSVDYSIINPWPMLGTVNFDFVAEYLRETVAWTGQTQSWLSSLSEAGKASRSAAIVQRLARVDYFIAQAEDILSKSDALYETRYLLIDQRANRKDGTLAKAMNAETKRAEDEAKARADAKKLLLVTRLT
jgi:hypothetical protein